MKKAKASRESRSLRIIPIVIIAVISLILIVMGISGMCGARQTQREMDSSEHISGRVTELKIVNSYLHPVVEYASAGGNRYKEFARSDLYLGEQLTLILNNGDAEIYIDYYWDYPGSTSGFVMLVIGTLFLLILLACILKKQLTGKQFSIMNLIVLPFLIVGIVFLTIVIRNLSIRSDHPDKPYADDFTRTEAVLINVPEYEVKVSYSTNADGEREREEHTYFYGDTVAEYTVDNTVYLAKVRDDVNNYTGKKITLEYSRSSPGLTSGFSTGDREVVTLVFGIISAVFLLVSVSLIVLFQKSDK